MIFGNTYFKKYWVNFKFFIQKIPINKNNIIFTKTNDKILNIIDDNFTIQNELKKFKVEELNKNIIKKFIEGGAKDNILNYIKFWRIIL